ncbi:class II aldolase [Gluconacetobacter azotocaptans]|uniref:class II aldolase/adducin family protein n=1 Tax=Gluconacetobacter azotocaptans TaxID=142834 RepID=UPI00195E4538|nr:class II aldolase/adducin family protein [Gluconacetobacter azotocaptans]MBM9403758.1 class II aldolase [Gluconacetobacter azotocaptans]
MLSQVRPAAPMSPPALAEDELDALRRLSARLGADPSRTQGAGGNTSIKKDGTMWIKASGTWLAHALERSIMVPVALAPLLEAYRQGSKEAETALSFVVAQPEGTQGAPAVALRPSIETTVHAVIPWRVVIHLHCVETIAHAVRTDAHARVAARLDGLRGVHWALVPYARPGLPLARAIVGARPYGERANVHVLANHGLIVSADTVAGAEALLERVIAALAVDIRAAPLADLRALAALAEGSAYRLPADPAAHAIALDPATLAVARGAPLYPDHVIFLGDRIDLLEDGACPPPVAPPAAASMLVMPGRGVLLRRDGWTAGVDAMARCLADVASRLSPADPIRRLSGAEIHALTHWEAETYRQAVNGSPRHG